MVIINVNFRVVRLALALSATGLILSGNAPTCIADAEIAALQQGSKTDVPDNKTARKTRPNPAHKQSMSPANVHQRELDIFRRAIADNEETGPYNPALSETYYGMGLYLQRDGQHQEAIKLFNKAMHVERINQGIHSLAQGPALRALIDSRKAMNQIEEATFDYHRLLWLHHKNLGKSNTGKIPMLVELNRWHLTAYQLDSTDERADHLAAANDMIANAISLAKQSDADPTTLSNLLRQTAFTNFQLAHHQGDDWASSLDSRFGFAGDMQEILPARTGMLSRTAYIRGRRAHETIVQLLNSDASISLEHRIHAYTELGDWYLLFGKINRALEVYHQAIALIPQTEQPAALTKQLFNQPTMLPAVRNETVGSPGISTIAYVKMDISAKGRPSNIEVLKTGQYRDPKLTRQAYITIREARFRPRFENGNPIASQGEVIQFPLIH